MLISYCSPQGNFKELELPEEGGIIGYSEDCFIVLDEMGISAQHLRLTAVGRQLFAEDLQSLNGTYINRSLISEKREIKGGDSVLIGLALLCFEKSVSSWSITVVRQDSSRFIVEAAVPLIPKVQAEEPEEGSSTAVTVLASNDVKEALRSGNVEMLHEKDLQTDAPQADTAAADTSLKAMEVLGTYKLIKKIGKGGMGVVFLAKHRVMNTYRALKVFPHSLKEKNYEFFERFMREARIASEIRHPNIVGVMDAETDHVKKVSYIVMEFIDGGTLRRVLKLQKKLPEIQALMIAKGVAEALKAIAAHKIIHRDIKPDNIMFTRCGEVKLADLGIAKNEDEDVNLTRNDIMIGTPAYLSPEQIEDPKTVDIRSDIYSLGATLYEMLTGETPYAGKNTYEILQKMISESVPDPRKKDPRVSAVTARIVMKMLHKNPARRFQSPQALLNTLNELLQRHSAAESLSIVKSAVLGTELPAGVKKNVSFGPDAALSFLFFSIRQEIVEMFTPSGRNKVYAENTENTDISGEKNYSFQIASGLPEVKTLDLVIPVPSGTACKIVSVNDGRSESFDSENGKLVIKDLAPGEYKIVPQSTEKI